LLKEVDSLPAPSAAAAASALIIRRRLKAKNDVELESRTLEPIITSASFSLAERYEEEEKEGEESELVYSFTADM